MEDLQKRKNLIALTLNVDYWDYLGWRDTLASAEYSRRQRAYAKARGDGRVYTPQIVINGLDHAVGSRRRAVDRSLIVTRRGRSWVLFAAALAAGARVAHSI